MNLIPVLEEQKIFCIKPFDWTVSLLKKTEEMDYIIRVKKYYHEQMSESDKLGQFSSLSNAEVAIENKHGQYELELTNLVIARAVFEKAIEKLENHILQSWNEIKEEIDKYRKEQEEKNIDLFHEDMSNYNDLLYEKEMEEFEQRSKFLVTLEVEAYASKYIPLNFNANDEEYLKYVNNNFNENERNPKDYILSKFRESNKSNEELFDLFEFRKEYYDSFSEIKYNEFCYKFLSEKDEGLNNKIIDSYDFRDLDNDLISDIEDYSQELSKGIKKKDGESNLFCLLFRLKAKVKSTIYIMIDVSDYNGDYHENYAQHFDTNTIPANPKDFIQTIVDELKYKNKLIFDSGHKKYSDYSEIEFSDLWKEHSYDLNIDFQRMLEET